MFAVLVIIAILLALILIALVPEVLELAAALVGIFVGLAVLIVGAGLILLFFNDMTRTSQSDIAESESIRPSNLYRVELDKMLSFTDPKSCQMSPETEALFENLILFDPPDYVGRRGPPVKIHGFGTSTPAFTRTVDQGPGRNIRDNEATLAMRGTWHGLKVGSIRVRRMEESSFWEYQIRFSDPPAPVRSTLNDAGFNLPPVGEFRKYTGPGEVSVGIGIEEIVGGSALYCGSSVYY
ncbi:MAG: hypothetical protein KJZ64_02705 [Sphingomonadaceae bacterium]|nr:hypothetical protein [Sphingomonadaceae bacterium]